MKILVISDTHKDINRAMTVIDALKHELTMVIHLGDHAKDALDLSYIYPELNFHIVSGNCDFTRDFSEEKIVKVGAYKIFMTHGHNYRVKSSVRGLLSAALKKKVDVALYGHTHVSYNDQQSGVLIMNPGSLTQPRGKNGPSFGLLTANQEGIKSDIITYKGFKKQMK